MDQLSTDKKLPLANIRVLEIAEGFAGPWASALLGDLGAEVIKIEAIQRMDQTRGQPNPRPGTSTYPNSNPGPRPWNINQPFIRGNRNKLSLTLDLSRPRGVKLFKTLVEVSDVVLTNMVTGVPEKIGIDYPNLRQVRSDLIMLTSCGYGTTGPYAKYVAMAGSMDAISGHSWLRNYEGEYPNSVSYSAHTDAVNALTSAFAIVSAILYRSKTGKGQHLDVSGCEALMPHLGEAIMDYTLNERIRTSLGNNHPRTAPHMVYPTSGEEEWVAIAIRNNIDWQNLRRLGGKVLWANDPTFRTVLGRLRHRNELNTALSEWTIQFQSHTLVDKLQKAGIPAARVLSHKDVLTNPHIQDRQFFEPMYQADLGLINMSGIAWKMSYSPGRIRLPPPLLGEHNHQIYHDLLGLDDPSLSSLVEDAYTGTIPLNIPV